MAQPANPAVESSASSSLADTVSQRLPAIRWTYQLASSQRDDLSSVDKIAATIAGAVRS